MVWPNRYKIFTYSILAIFLLFVSFTIYQKNKEATFKTIEIRSTEAIGSGIPIIYEDEKFILTAAHLVPESEFLWTRDGSRSILELVDLDERRDIALLSTTVKNFNWVEVPRTPPNYNLGDLIIHESFLHKKVGFKPEGIIVENSTIQGKDKLTVWAHIVPGSSGGPVFLKETDELIGIITHRSDGFGHATPIEEIIEFLNKNAD